MSFLVPLLGAVAGLAWLVALISVIAMLKHRAAGVTIFYLMTHGAAFFMGAKFTEGAIPHRRRFLFAFVVFMLSVVGLALVAIVLKPS